MIKPIVFSSIPAALIVAGVTFASPAFAQDEQAVVDTIESLTDDLMTTWSDLDPDAYLQFFSDDVQFYFRGWSDREQFGKMVRRILSNTREYPYEITDRKIRVLGQDAAVATLIYRAQPVSAKGESSDFEAAYTLVYERRDGAWKVVHAHESVTPEEQDE